jgi:quinolinate synthase
VKAVQSVASKKVIFIPDQNLGMFIQRSVKDKEMILWPGICPTHHNIKKEDLLALKKLHPAAEILVHPECRPEVIDIADHAFSTSGMVHHMTKTTVNEFIIGTERDMCYRLKKDNPEKTFYPVPSAVCPNMKKITLEKVYKSLQSLEQEIVLSPEIIEAASKPLQRMMAIQRGD